MFAELYLTNGELKLDLLGANKPRNPTGIAVRKMLLSRPQRNPSGIFRQTYGSVNETYNLSIVGFTPDEVALSQQHLDRWLEQAQNFFETSSENQLIWMVARALNETNFRYAVIYGGVVEAYGDVYAQPFVGNQLYNLDDVTLGLERSTWMANPPYEAACLPVHNVHSWNPNSINMVVSRSLTTVQSIFVTSAGTILAASNLIDRSIDGGNTWSTELTTGIANLRFWDFVQTGAGRIWTVAGMTTGGAVVESGIYYSDDDGDNWTQFFPSFDMYSVEYLAKDDTLFFGANGTLRRKIGSGSLTSMSTLPANRVKALALDSSGNLTLADGVAIWWVPYGTSTVLPSEIENVVSTDDSIDFLTAIAVKDHILLANNSSILISRNGGRTFNIYWRSWGINAFNILHDGSLLASRAGNTGIYRSNDDGLSWTLFLDTPAQPTRAIAEYGDSYIFYGSLDNVYRQIAIDDEDDFGPLNYDCYSKILVANHSLQSNWTHIFVFDSSAGTFTLVTPEQMNLIANTVSEQLMFPSPIGVGDIFYIGIVTNSMNAGPFTNVYFQLVDNSFTQVFVFEYHNGSTWVAFTDGSTMRDGTRNLRYSGLVSFCLPYNEAMAAATINSVTAWWIRIRVTVAGSGIPTIRNVYIAQKPYVEMEGIRGDIPALARALIGNETYLVASSAVSFVREVIMGLRTVERGDGFTSIINFARIQNPLGITVAPAVDATWQTDATISAAGEFVRLSTAGSSVAPLKIAYVQFDTKMSNDYAGIYQVYLRLARSGGDSDPAMCKVRLSVQSFSSTSVLDPGIRTEYVNVPIAPPYSGFFPQQYSQCLYLGQITFKPDKYLSINDSGYLSQIAVEALCIPAASNYVISLFDIILIPADEWIGHFYASDWAESSMYNDELLDVDSVFLPKRVLRSFLRKRGSESINSAWTASASGAFTLQPGGKQRLWIFTPINHNMVLSAKLWHNPRWLGLRGND